MCNSIGQPFPKATKEMRKAFANAAYLQVSFNGGIDENTGELVVDLFEKEFRGSVGDVLEHPDVHINQAPVGDNVSRLNLAFMLGRLSAELNNNSIQEE